MHRMASTEALSTGEGGFMSMRTYFGHCCAVFCQKRGQAAARVGPQAAFALAAALPFVGLCSSAWPPLSRIPPAFLQSAGLRVGTTNLVPIVKTCVSGSRAAAQCHYVLCRPAAANALA